MSIIVLQSYDNYFTTTNFQALKKSACWIINVYSGGNVGALVSYATHRLLSPKRV